MARKIPITDTAKAAYWQKHISCWRHGGMSQAQYCQKNMLALSTFTFWKKKLSQSIKTPSTFYPLTVVQDRSEHIDNQIIPESGIRLILAQGRFIIEMGKDFSPEALSRLINTLEKLETV